MKILVAGGAGFIGGRLRDTLLESGHSVMVVDVTSLGQPTAGQRDLQVVQHDVTLAPSAAMRRFKAERIYNLACASGPARRAAAPVESALTSVIGARQLLDLARDVGARFLQGSSGSVYGDPAVHPQPETYHGNVALGPECPGHGEAKRSAESLCYAYARQHGVDVRVARIFNTYGPQMSLSHGDVMSNFIAQALSGAHLTVHGDGTQTRSFCHVDDIVRGLMALMESDVASPVNLGGVEEQTLLQLTERILRTTGSQSRLRFDAPRIGDAHRRRPDISVAERELDWRPRISLQQGLAATIDALRQHANAPEHS